MRRLTVGTIFDALEQGEALQSLLRSAGYEVTTRLANVDLILVDREAGRRLKDELLRLKAEAEAQLSFLPALVLLPSPEEATAWLSQGFDDVLPYPVEETVLLERIRSWLHLRHELTSRLCSYAEKHPIGLFRVAPTGQLIYANPALLRMLGFASLDELRSSDLFAEHGRSIEENLGEGKEIAVFPTVWKGPDGKEVWAREHVRTEKDEKGRVLYHEGIVVDITEEKGL